MNDWNVDDILGGEDSWYEVSDKKPQSTIKEGKHLAKVVDLNIKEDKEIQGKFLADIFEPVFMVGNIEVKHKGLFRFKKPDPSLYPHLQADMGSNAGYYAFMNVLGLVVEKDGKVLLPPLTLEMIKDKEFEVEVVVEKWTGREGNEMQTPRVKSVYKTKPLEVTDKNTGDQALVNDDDLPF
mgnify:FL=1